MPGHVAVIMDGNGRWAKERRLPRFQGHRQGAKRAEEIIKKADELGVKYLTLYAFSVENWKRPKREVDGLMRLLYEFLKGNFNKLMRNNICFKVIGRKEPLPDYLWRYLMDTQLKTAGNSGLTLILALNYGSRQEILEAVRAAAKKVSRKELRVEDIQEDIFSSLLFTNGVPDPDLLIRTSGELRISNFLLWQLSYSELYFTRTLWPDFKAKDFEEAVNSFHGRLRRFGAI